MRSPLDILRRDKKDLPPLAGGAPQPGEKLCEGTRFMADRYAETARQWVNSWRDMSPAEYEASARRL
jgi:hypothetical protein